MSVTKLEYVEIQSLPNVASLLQGFAGRTNDVLALPFASVFCEPSVNILSKGFARDSHAVAGHVAALDEVVNHARNASDGVDIFHDVLATWLQIGKQGNAIRNALEIIDGQSDTDGVGDGNKVENDIGGTAQSHGQYLIR